MDLFALVPEAPPAFRQAVERTLVAEGTFSDEAWDPGGTTAFGITRRTAESWKLDVETLTVEQAVDIYHQRYWADLGLDALESPEVAFEIFDTAVHLGPGRAVRIAQEACEALGQDLKLDCQLGPETFGALNQLSGKYEEALLLAMNGFQFVYYQKLRQINPALYDRAIRGWMKRLRVYRRFEEGPIANSN